MHCQNCGNVVPLKARFCSSCGTIASPSRDALVPLVNRERVHIASAQRLLIFTSAVILAIGTATLHSAAVSLLALALTTICLGWSRRSLSSRAKFSFCLGAVCLIALAQIVQATWISKTQEAQRVVFELAKVRTDLEKAEAADAEKRRFAGMTPAEHYQFAVSLLKSGATQTDEFLAFTHLNAADPAMHVKAEALRAAYNALKVREATTAAKLAQKEAKQQAEVAEVLRVSMAKTIENRMLDKGFNVDVTTLGPQHTTMKLRYIFVSKVFAHQLSNDGEFFDSLKKAGFKKLVATDGYNESWSWNLAT